MRRFVSYTLFVLACTWIAPAAARVERFPSSFKMQEIKTAAQNVRTKILEGRDGSEGGGAGGASGGAGGAAAGGEDAGGGE